MGSFSMLLLTVLLACVGPDPVGSSLQAPWGALNLPIADGVVEEVSAADLHVVYDDGNESSVNRLGIRFGSALERAGWKLLGSRSAGPMTELTYSKSEAELRLILSQNGKRVDVQVEFK